MLYDTSTPQSSYSRYLVGIIALRTDDVQRLYVGTVLCNLLLCSGKHARPAKYYDYVLRFYFGP